jgi:signal transduction histidine kinase
MDGGTEASAPGQVEPLARVEAIAATCRRLRGATVVVEADAPLPEKASGAVTIGAAAFDAVLTHLLDNAVEAAGPAAAIHIVLRHEQRRVLVDIVDRGPGMTPDFVRDELFRPFRTSKQEGSGIGAFQARELLREAGGDLIVLSRPGEGTTMRMLLPRKEGQGSALTPGGSRAEPWPSYRSGVISCPSRSC